MIKEATIFGVGFGLGRVGEEPRVPVATGFGIFALGIGIGYSFAMRSIEPQGEIKKEAADFIRTTKGILVDAWLDVKKEMADTKAEEEQKDETVVEGTATEEPLDTPPSEKTDDAGQQGETPS